ncbi:MAG TPA: AMP-binding protein, partial [Rhodopila sp.]
MMDGIEGARGRAATPWTSRLIFGGEMGVCEPPGWLVHCYDEFRRTVTDPAFPCFFGTQAETRGEMFYSFVNARDLSHLPATMAKFAELSAALENQRNNFAVFFEPSSQQFTHDEFRRACWNALQYLHDHDNHPTVMEQPDPTDAAWEFSFAGMQMFVVGCSPSYCRRRSRNIGPGIVMLFQPRSVFIDTVTKREIGIEARASVRRRLLAWDGVAAHPDLGVYGDPDNREWKQYFLPDTDAPEAGTCPFLSRRRQAAIAGQDGRAVGAGAIAGETAVSLASILRQRARDVPDRLAIRFLVDGETVEETLTYGELDVRVRSCAEFLLQSANPGERALLLLPSGLDYVVSFLACLYAGIVAVPAYPAEAQNAQHFDRLRAMLRDCAPSLLLTDEAHLSTLDNFALADLPAGARRLIVRRSGEAPCAWQPGLIRPEQIAFLQYTSGSTSSPKGVVVTHGNILANEALIGDAMEFSTADGMVSWLPLYHDMGLIGGLLAPLFNGFPVTLMAPQHFLESPVRWLRAVSRYRATVSGGPDFAYQLCLDRIHDRQLDGVDLSSWRVAFCGAEPIQQRTMQSFRDRFGKQGLKPGALYPCYGLAETTLLASGGRPGSGAMSGRFSVRRLAAGQAVPDPDGRAVIDCGSVQARHQIRIVDPGSGRPCDDGTIGEIWLSGPSIAAGYWEKPQATEATFRATLEGHPDTQFLRTGDLGFMHGGRLFVSGRLKDLIILRGQNIYPQDIEQRVAEQVKDLRKGRVATFALSDHDPTGFGIAAEISRVKLRQIGEQEVFRRICHAVAASHQEPVQTILLLQPGDLPRTSSGKLRRSACVPGWQNREFVPAAVYQRGGAR